MQKWNGKPLPVTVSFFNYQILRCAKIRYPKIVGLISCRTASARRSRIADGWLQKRILFVNFKSSVFLNFQQASPVRSCIDTAVLPVGRNGYKVKQTVDLRVYVKVNAVPKIACEME